MDTLQLRLKHARKLRNLTQVQLAELAGVQQSAVSNIEGGTRTGLQSLAPLASALQVRYWWLRDGTGEMELPQGAKLPFSEELLERLLRLDHAGIEKAENTLRVMLDMPTINRNGEPTEKQRRAA